MEVVQYDEQMISEIVDKIDLLEYVSQNLEMERRGSDYFAHCPKHVDITPSFSITPAKNRFYCFSCGRGGTIINYLMMYEGLRYDEAVDKAAKLARVDLTKMCNNQTFLINRRIQKDRKTHQVKECNHVILDWNLYDKFAREPVTEWLDENISQNALDLFQIRIDRNSNRVVYPVFDMEGNFINIKGRTRFSNFKTLKIPKYINYYPVGVMDYFQGYQQAAKYIYESKEVKIFESIKSVMKLFDNNIKDVISAEKHTLTIEQIRQLIIMGVENVILCWDSDVSYQSSDVMKNIQFLKRFMNVYVICDTQNLLGGISAKNSPIDCGLDVWNYIYRNKKKIT